MPHRRVAMACLVKAVYNLEKDPEHRERWSKESEVDRATATWWTHFGYELEEMLTDRNTVFGAVYRSQTRPNHGGPSAPPSLVVSFRGTMLRTGDCEANALICFGKLELHRRYEIALAAVERAVEEVGWERVCVTGHSMGAAIALLAGRAMAKKGKLLEAHLFNPPHLTARGSCERLPGMAEKEESSAEVEMRMSWLRRWQPHLYIHTHDPICSRFIDFFCRTSYSSSCQRSLPSDRLIPCARLFIRNPYHSSSSSSQHILEPHKLLQWCHAKLPDVSTIHAKLPDVTKS